MSGMGQAQANIVSGSVMLDALTSVTPPSDALFQVVGSYNAKGGGKPLEAVISTQAVLPVTTGPLSTLYNGNGNICLYAGQYIGAGSGNNWAAVNGNGMLRWKVANGGTERVFYSDLVPGRYSLGVCDYAFVSACRWLGDVAYNINVPMLVNCGLSEGVGGAYDEFTYTMERVCAEGEAFPTLAAYTPPRARWWVPYFASGSDSPVWGNANAQTINFGGAFRAEQVKCDPSLDQPFTPMKHRYELAGANSALEVTGTSEDSLAESFVVGIRYYLTM